MLSPASEAELSEVVAAASGPLRVVGGGTRSIGASDTGEVLSLNAMSGIELYEPGALTLVAKAGTPLAEVEGALAKEGQMLPFEPADMRALLGRDGVPTIGGVVAANAAGPRRMMAGACRDALIGVRFVDGAGTVLKNGGRVMKNVTGYDLVKLMAGSWGTLGVLSEVAFKVLPRLDGATLLVRGAEGADALEAMVRGVTSPFEVSGAAVVPGEGSYLRIEGLETSVAYRIGKLTDLLRDLGEIEVTSDANASAAIWTRIRDMTDFTEAPGAVWRVSMKPTDMVDRFLPAIAEIGVFDHRLDWAGGLAWLRLEGDDASIVAAHHAVQAAVTENGGGHATLFRAPESVVRQVDVFQPEAPGVAALSKGLRAKFDPRGILNPGLMGGA